MAVPVPPVPPDQNLDTAWWPGELLVRFIGWSWSWYLDCLEASFRSMFACNLAGPSRKEVQDGWSHSFPRLTELFFFVRGGVLTVIRFGERVSTASHILQSSFLPVPPNHPGREPDNVMQTILPTLVAV